MPRPSPRTSKTAVLESRIKKLTSLLDVAKAMTKERDLDTLLSLIAGEATKVADADRCTLWIVDAAKSELWMRVGQGLELGQRVRIPIGKGIAGAVAETSQVINLADAYADPRFNRRVDLDTGYRTRHILAVPMRYHDDPITGVLQALNKKSGTAFTAEDEELLLALGANAAAAVQNAMLYEEIDQLFEGFVHASVTAIESRDPTTSGHSERVAELSMGIAEQLARVDTGPYARLTFTRDELRELRYAALLHDFGKVGVRENVLVKERKLYDHEMQVIEARFGVLRAQRENSHLRRTIEKLRRGIDDGTDLTDLEKELAEIDGMLAFVRSCNQPTVMHSDGFEKLNALGCTHYHGAEKQEMPILTDRERLRLSIPKGSLDVDERREIESHVTHTYRFLAQIPWTKSLRHIPDIAHAHHEKLDGTGYPRQLSGDAIGPQSRMIAIADIYDALTARDRPYKPAMPHERAMDILSGEVRAGKVDPALFDIFLGAEVYKRIQPR